MMGASRRLLWLAAALAPAAWAVDLEATYALAARACGAGPGHRLALWVVPLAAVVVSASGALLAARGWTRAESRAVENWPPDRFLAASGLVTSAFFIFLIVVQAIPTLVLSACD